MFLLFGKTNTVSAGGAVDLVEDVLGGGVHGLPAGHYAVRAELAEELRHAVARADGDRAVGLLGGGELRLGGSLLRGLAAGHLAVLLAHILYLHLQELP